MPSLPVHHQLPEFTQTHVYQVGDAIQPSHPLSLPSPPSLNLSQHQGLSKWVNSLPQVAKVLEFVSTSVLPMNTQDWSPLGWTGWTSLQSKGVSRVFSNTTIQKHQFFGAQLSRSSYRTIQLQLLQHYWLGHRLRLLWHWMICLGNEQKSFFHFRDCVQVLHLELLLIMRVTPFLLRNFCPQ